MCEAEFRKAIDDAILKPRPAVTRHDRSPDSERARAAMKVFREILEIPPLGRHDELGGIIGSYVVGGSEGTRVRKSNRGNSRNSKVI